MVISPSVFLRNSFAEVTASNFWYTASNSRRARHQTASDMSNAKQAAKVTPLPSQFTRTGFHAGITWPSGCARA